MFRRSVLICALVFSAPVMWAALVDHSVSLEAAAIRYLIAIPVAAALIWLVRIAAQKPEPADDGADDSDDAALSEEQRV